MIWKAVPTQEVTSPVFLCFIVFRMFHFFLTLYDIFIFFTPSFQLIFPNFAITKFQNEQNISFLLLCLVHAWLGDKNRKLQGKFADRQINNINFISQQTAVCLKSAISLLVTKRSPLLSRWLLLECKLIFSFVLFIFCRKYVGKWNMPLRSSSFYRFPYVWLCIWEIVFMSKRSLFIE